MENVPLQGKTVMFFHAEGACEHAHVCDGPWQKGGLQQGGGPHKTG